MRTSRPTPLAVHDAKPAIALGTRRRTLGLTLLFVMLAIPVAVEAGSSTELRVDQHSEIAVQQAGNAAEVAALQEVDAEMEQLLAHLEGLTGRIAQLEEQLDGVVPPAPQVRCSLMFWEGCWVE